MPLLIKRKLDIVRKTKRYSNGWWSRSPIDGDRRSLRYHHQDRSQAKLHVVFHGRIL